MTDYILPLTALIVGLLANITMRKSKSRVAKVFIGIPAMILMLALVVFWIR